MVSSSPITTVSSHTQFATSTPTNNVSSLGNLSATPRQPYNKTRQTYNNYSQKRVFSSTGLFITDRRNRLQGDIVEAVECLKS